MYISYADKKGEYSARYGFYLFSATLCNSLECDGRRLGFDPGNSKSEPFRKKKRIKERCTRSHWLCFCRVKLLKE